MKLYSISIFQRSLLLGIPSGLYRIIETIEKTDMRLGISVKKQDISIYRITSTYVIHLLKAMHDNALATHLRYGKWLRPSAWTCRAK